MRAKIIIAGLLLVMGGAAAYWYSHGSAKLSETDAILIGGFSNATGDSVFDGSLREALAISLTQSPMLNVVSAEKVGEAFRSLGRPADTPITRVLASKLCQQVGATVYLTETIARDDNGYALRLNAFRCVTDDALASANGDAASRGAVLHTLGLLAADLRRKLGEDPPPCKDSICLSSGRRPRPWTPSKHSPKDAV